MWHPFPELFMQMWLIQCNEHKNMGTCENYCIKKVCSVGELNPGLSTLPFVAWNGLQTHILTQLIYHPNKK